MNKLDTLMHEVWSLCVFVCVCVCVCNCVFVWVGG